MDPVPEEGFPCRLRHGGLRGGLIRVCGVAGADLLEGVHHVHPLSPSRSPGPLQPAAELPQGGDRPPDQLEGAWLGDSSEPEVLEQRSRGLGVEDAYGRWG